MDRGKGLNRRQFIKSSAAVAAGTGLLNIIGSTGCSKNWKDMNLVFISLDTLRPDHCSFMGYHRKTTPFLDDWSKDALIFEEMHTPSPWTDQSHASIFSSLYPRVHSISAKYTNKLRFSLASILKEHGYTTAGFVETISLDSRIGIATGFDTYMNVESLDNYNLTRAPYNNKRIFEWLQANHKNKFFMFAHYFDIHYPYSPPGKHRFQFREGKYSPSVVSLGSGPWYHRKPTGDEIEQVKSLYDGEIAFTDRWVEQLITRLEQLGIADKTIIVLFSDHGEGFYEHQLMSHGNSLYQELLKIVTVMKFPDQFAAGQRVQSVTRSIDITPTLLDYLGATTEEKLQGVSLVPMIEKNERRDLMLFADGIRYAMSVRKGKWKLIYNHIMNKAVTDKIRVTRPEFELYNLEDDPGEKTNLSEKHKDIVQDCYKDIKRSYSINEKWKRGFIMGQKKAIDKDIEKGLRNMGYLL